MIQGVAIGANHYGRAFNKDQRLADVRLMVLVESQAAALEKQLLGIKERLTAQLTFFFVGQVTTEDTQALKVRQGQLHAELWAALERLEGLYTRLAKNHRYGAGYDRMLREVQQKKDDLKP